MPFTEYDCVKECLLNVMIADAWAEERSGGNGAQAKAPVNGSTQSGAGKNQGLSTEHVDVITAWMDRLNVEGPERDRLHALTTHPVDPFQAQVFHNELRTTLSKDSCRAKIAPVRDMIAERKDELHPLEEKFSASVKKALNENSCIEQHIRKALGM